METTHTLLEDVPGFIQVYADGFVARFDHRLTPASPDPVDGARSKDVLFHPSTGVWARFFLPQVDESEKLPLVFYFHGGGFCVGSTAWGGFHQFLTGLAARARVMIVSVDYRLAPEHRLPAAYDDCFDALCWIRDNRVKDPWLHAHADYNACFLAGESAGGNIVHVVGSRAAGRADMSPLKIRGLVVVHPYFGSEERIECEKAAATEVSTDNAVAVEYNELFWRLAIPQGCNRDYPACNPAAPGAPDLRDIPLPPLLVTVAGLDLLKARGVMYYELLKSCGKDAELDEAEGQIHAYHVFHPQSEAAALLQDRIAEFLRRFNV